MWIDHECQCQRLKYDKIWCFNLNSPSRGKGPNQDSDQSSAFLPMFLFKSLTVSNRFLKFNSVRLWKVCWTHLYMDCWIKWQTNFCNLLYFLHCPAGQHLAVILYVSFHLIGSVFPLSTYNTKGKIVHKIYLFEIYRFLQ